MSERAFAARLVRAHGTARGIALAIAVLAALLVRGFRIAERLAMPVSAVSAFLLSVLYGAITEGLQALRPERSAEFTDLFADALGAAVTVALIAAWLSKTRFFAPRRSNGDG